MNRVGGQTQSIRKKDMKPSQDTEDITTDRDQVSISDQAREGQKAGETTGIAGRKGSKQTRKKDEAAKQKESQVKEKLDQIRKDVEDVKAEPKMPKEEAAAEQKPPGGPEGPGGQQPGGQQPGGPGGPGGTPSNSETDKANRNKAMQDDFQQAQTIYMQMAMDRQKWMAQIWKILQDTQNEITKIMQEVAVRRAQTMDAMAAKWAAVLGGYA